MSEAEAGGSGGVREEAEAWWQTRIIDMRPNEIRFAGYAVEELMGRISFPAMIWLMLRGELPNDTQTDLLSAALVGAVDHGPQAPSIAAARMAITCGVGLNNAMATGANMLGDVHGGAGEQALELFLEVCDEAGRCEYGWTAAAASVLKRRNEAGERYMPGFGHRFHTRDPRPPRMLQLVDGAVAAGAVDGRVASAARAMEHVLEHRRGSPVRLNVDGGTAVIYGELGFPPPLCRGLFVLARSVGILAHAWEQHEQGGRNKGPLPRSWYWKYSGPSARPVCEDAPAASSRRSPHPDGNT